jgi:hypothetical protein
MSKKQRFYTNMSENNLIKRDIAVIEYTDKEKQWAYILKEYFDTISNDDIEHFLNVIHEGMFLETGIDKEHDDYVSIGTATEVKIIDTFSQQLYYLYGLYNEIQSIRERDVVLEVMRTLFIKGIAMSIAFLNEMTGGDKDYILNNAHKLAVSKHHDYGSENILKFGLLGIIIRTSDKTSRLVNLFKEKRNPKTDSIKDTFYDIINYCAYALILIDDKWIS